MCSNNLKFGTPRQSLQRRNKLVLPKARAPPKSLFLSSSSSSRVLSPVFLLESVGKRYVCNNGKLSFKSRHFKRFTKSLAPVAAVALPLAAAAATADVPSSDSSSGDSLESNDYQFAHADPEVSQSDKKIGGWQLGSMRYRVRVGSKGENGSQAYHAHVRPKKKGNTVRLGSVTQKNKKRGGSNNLKLRWTNKVGAAKPHSTDSTKLKIPVKALLQLADDKGAIKILRINEDILLDKKSLEYEVEKSADRTDNQKTDNDSGAADANPISLLSLIDPNEKEEIVRNDIAQVVTPIISKTTTSTGIQCDETSHPSQSKATKSKKNVIHHHFHYHGSANPVRQPSSNIPVGQEEKQDEGPTEQKIPEAIMLENRLKEEQENEQALITEQGLKDQQTVSQVANMLQLPQPNEQDSDAQQDELSVPQSSVPQCSQSSHSTAEASVVHSEVSLADSEASIIHPEASIVHSEVSPAHPRSQVDSVELSQEDSVQSSTSSVSSAPSSVLDEGSEKVNDAALPETTENEDEKGINKTIVCGAVAGVALLTGAAAAACLLFPGCCCCRSTRKANPPQNTGWISREAFDNQFEREGKAWQLQNLRCAHNNQIKCSGCCKHTHNNGGFGTHKCHNKH